MEFIALPNGLSSVPRIYTKVPKPLYSKLRKQGHTNVVTLMTVYCQVTLMKNVK